MVGLHHSRKRKGILFGKSVERMEKWMNKHSRTGNNDSLNYVTVMSPRTFGTWMKMTCSTRYPQTSLLVEKDRGVQEAKSQKKESH